MAFADKAHMQHRLFAELSRMFGLEVPLYHKALLVNRVCNTAACDLLAQVYKGFSITDEQLDKTSGERHGAIRIGRPDEYRWVCRFFAAFDMQPHNFYDMASVGSKSQPIVATAFRSTLNPEHRVFTSLLQTDYFDPETRARIEAVMAPRQVFSDRAKALIEKGEKQGGLEQADADALIREGTDRIFKWTGKARDHKLYKDLCDAGFKIAADIACFESHHLNHLTPNTFCMDLFSSAMKFCMGEITEAAFRERATTALERVRATTNRDAMRLLFRHLTRDQIEAFTPGEPAAGTRGTIARLVDSLTARLTQPDLTLKALKHAGFKDFTEGPAWDTPVFLRQDAYKALTEPVEFTNADATTTSTTHTARFGEIEQRAYACTPKGRALYDACLAAAEAARDKDPSLPKRDPAAYEAMYSRHFVAFPRSIPALLEQGLIFARYAATANGLSQRGRIKVGPAGADISHLLRDGYARYDGLRYEDFLPVSAAGIFASNLNQYGTKSTAAVKPTYTQAALEATLGRAIIDADAAYRGIWAASVLETFEALGLTEQVAAAAMAELERAAQAAPVGAMATTPVVPTQAPAMASARR